MKFKLAGFAALMSILGHAFAAPLPQLNIDKTQTTVSGASSGGYMAVQLHVAYSASFQKGAAVISGGPFNCAEGTILNALNRCFGKSAIPVADLIATTNKWAKEGLIDATSNLAASKVYLYSAVNDSVVKEPTTIALQDYYASYLAANSILYKKDIAAEHGFVTDDFGAGCLKLASPFLINCNFDLAGALLQHLYGPLSARKTGAVEGSLLEFDQSAFVTAHGMGTSAYVFIPKACSAGAACRLHVALHGCRQNTTDIGDAFARNAGYNRWADTNNMVVLYPQTGKGAVNSCWDWWGYDDTNYAKKSAPQMAAIMAMVNELSRGAPAPAKR